MMTVAMVIPTEDVDDDEEEEDVGEEGEDDEVEEENVGEEKEDDRPASYVSLHHDTVLQPPVLPFPALHYSWTNCIT